MKIYFIDANNTTPQVNYPLLETLKDNFDSDVTYFSSNFSEHTDYYDKNYNFKKRYIYSNLINKIGWRFLRRFLKIFSYSISSFVILITALFRKPNIIHFNWLVNPFFDYFIISLYKNFGFKVVLTQHNYFQHGKRKLRFYEKNVFRSVDKIICLSEYVAEQFDEEFQNKITVIEHGNTYEKDILINKGVKNPEDKIKILFMGGIFPYKGIELLISAVSNIKNDDILLYILGSGDEDYIKDLKKKLVLHNLLNNTFFENDYINHKTLFNSILNCSFGVLPYKEATQSGVPFMFYNLHKPIILTNVGGLAENIDKRFTKVINPDVRELENAINEMIHELKKGNIKDEYFEEFLKKNRWIDTVKKYYELYKSII